MTLSVKRRKRRALSLPMNPKVGHAVLSAPGEAFGVYEPLAAIRSAV